MKRIFGCFFGILGFVLVVSIADIVFMSCFASGMDQRIEKMESAESISEMQMCWKELDDYYHQQDFWAHRLVPTNRLEELEILLAKMGAFLQEEDEEESHAIAAELKIRVNQLYSTGFYRWYQSCFSGIE